MSTSATQKKTHADAIVPLARNWSMTIDNPPAPLSALDQLQITAEMPEPGGSSDQIIGSVRSAQSATLFQIEDGWLSLKVANILQVSFTLTLKGGLNYTFMGVAQGSRMKGFYAPLSLGSVSRGVETEEGSWSAQAQPGTDEEEFDCPPKRAQRIPR